ncbi:MAG: ABC transporter permease [Clostridia bacterium]|nr:ABC transporter permease [Clostridia bacterium]
MIYVLLTDAISLAAVLLYGCVGETITEKAGHLNLGIPGIMCMGTAGGCLFLSWYLNGLTDFAFASLFVMILLSLIGAFLVASLTGGIYALLTVTLRCNQNITGLAMTTFGTGLCQHIMDTYVMSNDTIKNNFLSAGKLISKGFVSKQTYSLISVFFSHGFFVYFGIIVAVVAALVLKKTRVGLHLRAVGENPATADAAGINVTLYKYVAILIGSGIAGIGGVFNVMERSLGSWDNTLTIEGYGWLAIALVIFTLWKPDVSILGSFIFGALTIVPHVLSTVKPTQMELLKLLPYVVTVIVLIFTSIRKNRDSQAPAALGLAYFREDR